MPSSVDFFLNDVMLQDRQNRIVDFYPLSYRLPAGYQSEQMHLQTREKLGTLHTNQSSILNYWIIDLKKKKSKTE